MTQMPKLWGITALTFASGVAASMRLLKRALPVLAGLGTLALAGAASATTITLGSPLGCEPPTREIEVPGDGFVLPVSWDVTQCPAGILAYSAGGGVSIGGATHIYSIILEDTTSTGPMDITSGPYTTTEGFAISTFLDGFASAQGNPGVTFSRASPRSSTGHCSPLCSCWP